VFETRGRKRYGLTDAGQPEHALQVARLAGQGGDLPALIAAALLHDVGHLIHHSSGRESRRTRDRRPP